MPNNKKVLLSSLINNALSQVSFLSEYAPVVRVGGSIEALHRMRVASRRLRAATNALESVYGIKKIARWHKIFKKLGRVLGKARELDVQLRFLKSVEQIINDSENKKNLICLIKEFKKIRKKIQRKIIRLMNKIKKMDVFDKLKFFLEKLGKQKRAIDDKLISKRRKAFLLKKINNVLNYSKYVNDPLAIQELHLLRIAVKNLRYSLEIFSPRFSKDNFILRTKELQDVLGDLHEMDVWTGYLKDRSKYDFLLKKSKELRKREYFRFKQLWEKYNKEKLWTKMKRVF